MFSLLDSLLVLWLSPFCRRGVGNLGDDPGRQLLPHSSDPMKWWPSQPVCIHWWTSVSPPMWADIQRRASLVKTIPPTPCCDGDSLLVTVHWWSQWCVMMILNMLMPGLVSGRKPVSKLSQLPTFCDDDDSSGRRLVAKPCWWVVCVIHVEADRTVCQCS